MIHFSELTVRTYHTDAFGHINNSRYLELLEEARWRYSEDIGLTPLLYQQQLGFIIIDMRLRFRVPVSDGERLSIETSLISLGSASGEVVQTANIVSSQQKALTSLFHFILIERETGKSVPIEGDIRRLLLDVLETPEKKSDPTPQTS